MDKAHDDDERYLGHEGVRGDFGGVDVVVVREVEPDAAPARHVQDRREEIEEGVARRDERVEARRRRPKRLDIDRVRQRDEAALRYRLDLVVAVRAERDPLDVARAPAGRLEFLCAALRIAHVHRAAAEARR